MNGRTHVAFSALAATTATTVAVTAGVIPAAPLAATAALIATGAGAGLLPDLDEPNATASRSLGVVSQFAARITRAFAGGHRKGTHTIWWVGLFAIALVVAGPPLSQLIAGVIAPAPLTATLILLTVIGVSIGLRGLTDGTPITSIATKTALPLLLAAVALIVVDSTTDALNAVVAAFASGAGVLLALVGWLVWMAVLAFPLTNTWADLVYRISPRRLPLPAGAIVGVLAGAWWWQRTGFSLTTAAAAGIVTVLAATAMLVAWKPLRTLIARPGVIAAAAAVWAVNSWISSVGVHTASIAVAALIAVGAWAHITGDALTSAPVWPIALPWLRFTHVRVHLPLIGAVNSWSERAAGWVCAVAAVTPPLLLAAPSLAGRFGFELPVLLPGPVWWWWCVTVAAATLAVIPLLGAFTARLHTPR